MSHFIGIDVGTTSVKALMMDASGAILAKAQPAYRFQTPRPGWAESDPQDWWEATLSAFQTLRAQVGFDQVCGLGLSGQMHGLVLLDAQDRVLRPAIMWNDQRTGAECAALTEALGVQRVLEITGNPILPGFTAPKLRWVQANEPEVWAQIARILLPKDFIRYRLSGYAGTDVSDASGMSLLAVGKRAWSPEMLAAVDIDEAQLPELAESPQVTAQLSDALAEATGLPRGLPIVAGAGDQAAGAVGCGVVEPGSVFCSLGTSGVLFAPTASYAPEAEGRLHAFCAAVPGTWHLMGVQLSCAGSYQWFHDTLGGGRSFEALNALAEGVSPGAEGLFFLPYLSGERTPHPDPDARGVYCGLSLRHGLGHMARATLEGVTFGLRDTLELMRPLGVELEGLIAISGGSRSQLWRQLLADVFGARIETVNVDEGAAYGAAVLAAVGAGVFEDVPAATRQLIRKTSVVEPCAQERGRYDQLYPLYRELYPALKDNFRRQATLLAEA